MTNYNLAAILVYLCLFGLTIFSSCTQTMKTSVSCLIDVTETTTLPKSLSSEQVVELAHLDENIYNGIELRYSYISDVKYNQALRCFLPQTDALTSVEVDRKKEVSQFENDIDSLEQVIYESPPGRPKSLIFATIVDELQRLQEQAVDQRILLIYNCNLFENTPALSLYNQAHKKLLHDDPKAFAELLQSTSRTELPLSLTDTQVHFIFKPNNHTESHHYEALVHVYKKMLEERGAKVFIKANL